MRSAVLASILILLATSPILAGWGFHEGEKVFFMDRFQDGLAESSSGVAIDADTQALVLAAGDDSPYVRSGIYMSPPYRAERRFGSVMAGIRFHRPEGTEIDVAFRFSPTAHGPWSRWFLSARETEVELGGTYRYVQFRSRLRSSDGVRTPRLEGVSLLFGEAVPREEPETGRYAELPRPETVTREQWRARTAREAYNPHTPRWLIVHHTSSPRASSYAGASTIRGIQNYHMDAPSHGWIDIGYHFIIGPDGKIFEGRPAGVSGAHVVPNQDKVGICLVGNFQSPAADEPSGPQRAALLDLLAYLAGIHAIAPSSIQGHRDWNSTSCPGDVVHDWLPTVRAEVARRVEEAAGETGSGGLSLSGRRSPSR